MQKMKKQNETYCRTFNTFAEIDAYSSVYINTTGFYKPAAYVRYYYQNIKVAIVVNTATMITGISTFSTNTYLYAIL